MLKLILCEANLQQIHIYFTNSYINLSQVAPFDVWMGDSYLISVYDTLYEFQEQCLSASGNQYKASEDRAESSAVIWLLFPEQAWMKT